MSYPERSVAMELTKYSFVVIWSENLTLFILKLKWYVSSTGQLSTAVMAVSSLSERQQ